MHWLNVCVNCFLNRWFCYWILKSCCYFEICNNFTAPRWQSAPHECPGFKATSTFSLLLPSWLLYFFPLDPCLPPAPETSGFQTLVFIWLPKTACWNAYPRPQPPGFDLAGLGTCVVDWCLRGWVRLVSFWKELTEVEVSYEAQGYKLWEWWLPLTGFRLSASLLVDFLPARLI